MGDGAAAMYRNVRTDSREMHCNKDSWSCMHTTMVTSSSSSSSSGGGGGRAGPRILISQARQVLRIEFLFLFARQCPSLVGGET